MRRSTVLSHQRDRAISSSPTANYRLKENGRHWKTEVYRSFFARPLLSSLDCAALVPRKEKKSCMVLVSSLGRKERVLDDVTMESHELRDHTTPIPLFYEESTYLHTQVAWTSTLPKLSLIYRPIMQITMISFVGK